jgi:hypothetical protein
MNDGDELGHTLPRGSQGQGVAPTSAGIELPLQHPGRYVAPAGSENAELGRGGMGRVSSVQDTHLHREVAVKELLEEHTAQRSAHGPLFENLFVREARVLALLEHPGVVPVYELGRRENGTLYYVMRRIRGRSLKTALDACVSLEERLLLMSHFIDVAQTVGFAHSRGVIHRDLKSENVMVSQFGETLVIDWGLALIRGEPMEGTITSGTPACMSPEQAAGTGVDERSDVWALGIMLFEVLTGARPFSGTPSQVLDAARTGRVPQVTDWEPNVPRAFLAVIQKALQREPHARYPDAGVMADALERALRDGKRPTRWWPWLAAAAAVAVTVAAGLAVQSMRLDAAQTAYQREREDVQHQLDEAITQVGLEALRSKDGVRAQSWAERAPQHPLARGISWLATERGLPKKKWSVVVPAGCAAVTALGTTTVCATWGGLALYSGEGLSLGRLSVGPTGWQHAVWAFRPPKSFPGGMTAHFIFGTSPNKKNDTSWVALRRPSVPLRSMARRWWWGSVMAP